jgi:hypothetical protein
MLLTYCFKLAHVVVYLHWTKSGQVGQKLGVHGILFDAFRGISLL